MEDGDSQAFHWTTIEPDHRASHNAVTCRPTVCMPSGDKDILSLAEKEDTIFVKRTKGTSFVSSEPESETLMQ
mgnify:CR=1 FL=1